MHLRIAEAQRLLRLPDASVTMVSEHLGFENPYHFSRVFRRHTGVAPSAWQSAPDRNR
jgi:AraC-like DNA-binding protein